MEVALEPGQSSNAFKRRPARSGRRFALTITVPLTVLAVSAVLASGCVRARTPVVLAEPAPTTGPSAPLSAIGGPVRRGPLEANAMVKQSIDGDTIAVTLNDGANRSGDPDNSDNSKRVENVRLIGIDTPETKRPDTPIECFGKKASAATASLIPPGTPVRLERDVEERDRYGRLLAYVFRANDGLFINHELVRTGFAAAYTYPPNVAYTDTFREAAEVAQAVGVGLWGECGDAHIPAA